MAQDSEQMQEISDDVGAQEFEQVLNPGQNTAFDDYEDDGLGAIPGTEGDYLPDGPSYTEKMLDDHAGSAMIRGQVVANELSQPVRRGDVGRTLDSQTDAIRTQNQQQFYQQIDPHAVVPTPPDALNPGQRQQQPNQQAPPAPGYGAPEQGQQEQQAEVWDQASLNAMGMTEGQARAAYGSPDGLDAAVRAMDQRMMGMMPGFGPQPMWPQQPMPPQNYGQFGPGPVQYIPNMPMQPAPQQLPPWPQWPQQQHAPPADAQPGQQQERFELPPRADGEPWDEQAVQLAQQLNDFHGKRFEALQSQLAQHEQVLVNQMQQQQIERDNREVQELETFIESLGEDWVGTFGAGSGMYMDQRLPQFQYRRNLYMAAQQFEQNLAMSGQPLPSKQDTYKRVLRMYFPQQQQQVIRKQVVQEISDRNAQMTQRPTNRQAPPVPRRERAVQRVEALLAQHNWNPEGMEYDQI